MNKKITKLFAALALLMFLIPLTGWGQTWEKTAPADLTTDDIIVVVDLTSGKAMSNNNGTSSAPSAIAVTLNTNNDQITSEVGETIQWTLITSGSGDSRTYQLANGTNYLYVTAANNGVRVGSGTRNTFTIVSGGENNGYYLYNVDGTDNRYVGCYSASDWRCYATINNNIKINNIAFFKKITGGGGSDPEIQIAADELQLPWTANSGGYFNVTYTNDFEPFTAYAKLYNDAQGEEEFDGDWIELIEEDLSDLSLIEYGVQANTGTSVRTVYLYVEAMDESTNVINAMFTITQAAQPTYTVTYAPNGGSGTMTDPDSPYHEGDVVVLMASTFTAPEGMIWDSWQVKDADNNEVEVDEGMFEMPASNVTVTAQWVTDPSGPQYEWVLTPLANLTENDIFVIVGTRTDDTYGGNYAMTNNGGTQDPPTAFAVTIANDKLSSAPADNLKWNISGNATDGYTFYPNGSTENWLYCTNTNNGVRVGTNTNKTFTINSGYLYHDGTSRHVGIFNNQDWRCYSPQNGNVHNNIANQTFAFYKRQVASDEPSITLASYEVEVNANAHTTPTTIAVTYANIDFENDVPVVVFYESDGSTETTYDWLFVDLDADWNVYYTIDEENTNNAARTAYFKVLGYDSNGNNVYSNLASITQAAAPVVYTTIPALFAAATSTETPVTITFDNWVISAVKGNNAYLTDNAGNGLIIYQSDHGFQVNDVLTGTASCKLLIYKGSAELKNLTATTEGLTVTPNGTVTVQNIAISELSGVNTGALVAYENLTYTDGKLQDNEGNQITPYNTLYDYGNIFVEGHVYNVTGIYLQYNTTKEILPRSADDIEEDLSASIVVANANVQVEGTGGSGLLTVTYTGVDGYYANVQWCDQNGDPASAPLWLNAGLDENYDLTYMVGPNDGEARSAYLKIYVETEGVYSNLVTITQAEYVPDYAFLPFQYTDEDVLTGLNNMPNGLTQSGLGTYPGSTPRLKFDTKDDELVLKLNGTPKAITFDIKGNGFSGGTFIVQLSEDGSTYEDLATYTELGGTTQTHTFLNTNDNVRYIKWVYTVRQSGNVALGNIYVDDEYLVRGMATVAGDPTLDECTIAATGTLTIESGTLTVTDELTNEGNAASLIVEDGGQLITSNTVEATVKKNIYDWTTTDWYFIASPITSPIIPTGLITDELGDAATTDDATYDLYKLDRTQEKYWQNYRKHLFSLDNGMGYLYASKEGTTLEFAGAIQPSNENKTMMDLEGDFNLVGNPYTCTAYVNQSYYTLDHAAEGITGATVATSNATPIDPLTGVIIRGSSVTFNKNQPNAGAFNGNIQMTLAQQATNRGNATIDNAIVSFNEGSELEKFYFMQQNANLYIPQGTEEYAIVSSSGQGSMPVNFRANTNGQYTITVNAENVEMNYLHLIDNMTGADVDLLATPSYTFNATTSDYESRFRLVFAGNGMNAGDSESNFAFISDGNLIVSNEGQATLQVVDMQGRLVSSETINGSASLKLDATAGVYVIRLINNDNVKTQKVVVR